MIQADQQVCSVYNALQLKEFELPQMSLMYYQKLSNKLVFGRNSNNVLCSAYTSDELLNQFPYPIEKDGYTYDLTIRPLKYDFEIRLEGNQIDAEKIFYKKTNKSLADGLAHLLIHLYELEFFKS